MESVKLTRGTNIISNIIPDTYIFWCKKPNKVTGEMQLHFLHFIDHKERWIITESHFKEMVDNGSIEILKQKVYHL